MKIVHNTPELMAVLNALVAETGKSLDDVLAKEGREMSWALYQQAKAIPPGGIPRARGLSDAAADRHFKMGRRGSGMTPATAGISAAAWKAARNMLGGLSSAYFRVLENEGIPILREARFSARSGRLLRNRAGRYAPSALRWYMVQQGVFANERSKYKELKRLNLRAVATANEIRLRAMAAKGGTMAIQWLPAFYRKSKSATVKNGPIVSHNERTNIRLGDVDFLKTNGLVDGVRWTGYVPGTAAVMAKHGIPQKAEAACIADRMIKLEQKLTERYQKAASAMVSTVRSLTS